MSPTPDQIGDGESGTHPAELQRRINAVADIIWRTENPEAKGRAIGQWVGFVIDGEEVNLVLREKNGYKEFLHTNLHAPACKIVEIVFLPK